MRISDWSSDLCSSDLIDASLSLSTRDGGRMARRRLLTGEERRRLFDIPHDETAIVGNYTLAAEDLELVGRRYRHANRIGLATQIELMRHPGLGLQPDGDLHDAVLHYLDAQLLVDVDAFADNGQ